MDLVRVGFVSDTHLGFDMAFRPRIRRRRRGPDFFANFERALEPAMDGQVDMVVHGGDILYRSRVPARLVEMAFAPLKRVADRGIPVFVVPGNHERSRIPYALLAVHPNIHIFSNARTYRVRVRGIDVAVGGFPYARLIRRAFPALVQQTKLCITSADVRLLCVHHCVEGATVGPSGYTFREADDVIRATDLPATVAAVLSGHIHRHQVLTWDLQGGALPSPVFYPGSIERTSFAEKDETKGYLTINLNPGDDGGDVAGWMFHPLPARPMVVYDVRADVGANALEQQLNDTLYQAPSDAIVSLRIQGSVRPDEAPLLSAPSLRQRAPEMNISVAWR